MKRIKGFAAWAFLGLSFLLMCFYIYSHGIYALDADMSSELVLAKQLAEENLLVSPNWWYSTEIRLVNTQLVFMPLFGIFEDWSLVRALGSAVLLGLYLLCYYALVSAVGCRRSFAVSAAFLLLPCSMVYVVYVLFGVYYIPHVCFSFLIFALISRACAAKGKARIAFGVLLCLVSAVYGTGGLRALLVFNIPVLLASAALLAVMLRDGDDRSRQALGFLLSSLLAFVFALIGYLFNAKVLSASYSFSSFGGINFVFPSLERIELILHEWLRDFGYTEGSIFSGRLIYNLGCLCLIILIPWAVRDIIKKDSYSPVQRLLAMFFAFGALVYSAFIICSDFEYSARYSLPVAVFALPVLTVWLSAMDWKKPAVRAFALVFCALMLLCSVGKYRNMLQSDSTAELRHVTGILRSEGYTEGYATFWNGNIVTELSDGEIEMWILNHSLNGFDDIYHWLQSKSHGSEKPEGKFFLLIDNSELERSSFILSLDEQDKIYQGDHYHIYLFG